MSIKSKGDFNQIDARSCLKCGRELKDLYDNTVNTCAYCGQRHFVDIWDNSLTLTVAEKPQYRHRTNEVTEQLREAAKEEEAKARITALKLQIEQAKARQREAERRRKEAEEETARNEEDKKDLKGQIKELKRKLKKSEAALQEAEQNAAEWQDAAEGLAKFLEKLKAQGEW